MEHKPGVFGWTDALVRAAVAGLCMAAVAAVAAVDYATEYETAVSLLYIVPIVVGVWFSWSGAAIAAAVAGGASDSAVNYLCHHSCSPINLLNSIIQGTFFVVFAITLIALRHSQARLRELSRSDALTNVANSRRFLEIGASEIHRALRYKHSFSVLYMDIDDFKRVNDELGHSSGDVLLCAIAGMVKASIRRTDTIARLGGDEFALLLPETGADAARTAVDRIREKLADVRTHDGRPVTFSMGVITDNGEPCTFDQLLKQADALMYDVKRSGKNAVKFGIFMP